MVETEEGILETEEPRALDLVCVLRDFNLRFCELVSLLEMNVFPSWRACCVMCEAALTLCYTILKVN